MAGGRVWVDNELCHTFPTSNDTRALDRLPPRLSEDCASPLKGQVVAFTKDGDDTHQQFYYLNLCELQVWGQLSSFLVVVFWCVFFLPPVLLLTDACVNV